ncbi:helix-turn-helix transcriptional regulator [Phytoactinopolyspora endophytica]|uniref:helix-turn-helix transcriptional regulator n=1 Tax=Phytoactinopolyspora endophytica TaxID=1642495 RepID=UPI00101C49B8|nr:helix-turn-helix transcriptional regulator [Phytoactinopolyspora endophytica]
MADVPRTPEAAADDGAGELARGRAAAERLAWQQAYESLSRAHETTALPAADLELLATAAYLTGKVAACLHALQHASEAHAAAGKVPRAARCLFWLGFTLFSQGDIAQAGGWLARAARLLDREQGEHAESGLLLLPQVFQTAAESDHAGSEAIAARMADIGQRTGDVEVLSFALHEQGRAVLRQGRVREGMALLDESMVAVVAGELPPYLAGNLYCSMIDACREIAEFRRAHEWTVALTTWCDRQPDMVTFSGQCLVHRAEIMQLRGQWSEALAEAKRACERFADAIDQHAVGMAWYRLGEIYRVQGAREEAEDAYRRAGEWGRDPQPGLALLWLDKGRTGAARAALERSVAEITDPLRRATLLSAQVELALVTGDVDAATAACEALSTIAAEFGTPVLRAEADRARGVVRLVTGDIRDGLIALRSAWQLWRDLDAPYEAAKVRVLIGRGCSALGDDESAALELDSARRVFDQLGAVIDLARLDASIRHGSGPAATHGLTAREVQVLRLLASGKTNHAIAAELVLADKTVDRHVSNIYAKLGVNSRAAATAYAFQHRLVTATA